MSIHFEDNDHKHRTYEIPVIIDKSISVSALSYLTVHDCGDLYIKSYYGDLMVAGGVLPQYWYALLTS
jgi:hypothetical protein